MNIMELLSSTKANDTGKFRVRCANRAILRTYILVRVVAQSAHAHIRSQLSAQRTNHMTMYCNHVIVVALQLGSLATRL